MRLSKFISLTLAVTIVTTVPVSLARADAPAANLAASGKCSVTIEVVDDTGAVVSDVRVALILPRKHDKSETTSTTKNGRPKPDIIASGTTSANGEYTFTDIARGNYFGIAGLKGKGLGHERVSVVKGGELITITLEPREHKKK